MMRRWGVAALVLTTAVDARAQTAITVREAVVVGARSSAGFGSVLNVLEIADGRVLVNDGQRRQLLVLDGSMSQARVIVDSAGEGGVGYGPRASPVIHYLGDSSLFVDGAALSLVVLDGRGAISRVIAAPRPSDMRFLAGSASAVDPRGNLIYQGSQPAVRSRVAGAPDPQMRASSVDSAPILRASFETRVVDTLVRVKVPSGNRSTTTQLPDGRWATTMIVNPLTTIDEWAVLSDGTVAVVRGHDYHVDLIRPDGSRQSAPKLPFSWKRLTNAEKEQLLDLARPSIASTEARLRAEAAATAARTPGAGPPVPPRVELVSIDELPDHLPPIRRGAAKADLDGNLWILPSWSGQSTASGILYDVVNGDGVLTHRVRLPAGRSVGGFGRNGTLYLVHRDSAGLWFVERATAR